MCSVVPGSGGLEAAVRATALLAFWAPGLAGGASGGKVPNGDGVQVIAAYVFAPNKALERTGGQPACFLRAAVAAGRSALTLGCATELQRSTGICFGVPHLGFELSITRERNSAATAVGSRAL